MLVAREEKTGPKGLCLKNKALRTSTHKSTNSPKAGIGPILPLSRLLMRRDYGQSS